MNNGTVETKQIHSLIPAVNIVETPKSYVVTLDIPGAVKEKITADINNNVLTVTAAVAEYSASETAETAKQYRREFTLANDIDVAAVDAQYELGVLTITLNKKEQFLPKQIRIS